MGVEQKAHDALLAEVQRLEAELGRVRQDLQGVMGCQGKCEQLDTLQGTVRRGQLFTSLCGNTLDTGACNTH